jgi:hypothetical protein
VLKNNYSKLDKDMNRIAMKFLKILVTILKISFRKKKANKKRSVKKNKTALNNLTKMKFTDLFWIKMKER